MENKEKALKIIDEKIEFLSKTSSQSLRGKLSTFVHGRVDMLGELGIISKKEEYELHNKIYAIVYTIDDSTKIISEE